mgnify:CR=1 FL=1
MCSPSGRRSPVAESSLPWSRQRVRRMNSSPAEFRRALVQAFGEAVSETADGVQLVVGEVQIMFVLDSQPPRRIGALQIADLRVDISVQSGESPAADRLLAQVDRATQRGGG